MTRGEAIKTIDYLKEDYEKLLTEEDAEALEMAIEALKREDTMLKEIERVVLYGERSEENG